MCDLLSLCAAVGRGGRAASPTVLSPQQMPALLFGFVVTSWPQVPFVLPSLILAALWRALHTARSVSWAWRQGRLQASSWSSAGNYSGEPLSFLLNSFFSMGSRTTTRDFQRLQIEDKELLLLLSRWYCVNLCSFWHVPNMLQEREIRRQLGLELISDLEIQNASGFGLCCHQQLRSLECR